MLVVGDQAPYEEAAVSFGFKKNNFHFWIWGLEIDCHSPLWPTGGMQQQAGSNNNILPEGVTPPLCLE